MNWHLHFALLLIYYSLCLIKFNTKRRVSWDSGGNILCIINWKEINLTFWMRGSTVLLNKYWPMVSGSQTDKENSNVAEALSPVFFRLSFARFCILDQTIQMLSGLRYRAEQICALCCWLTDNGDLLPDCHDKKKGGGCTYAYKYYSGRNFSSLCHWQSPTLLEIKMMKNAFHCHNDRLTNIMNQERRLANFPSVGLIMVLQIA